MKNGGKIMMKIVLLFILLGFGCEKTNQDELSIRNFKYVGCKESSKKDSYNNESLKLKVNDSQYLDIEHISALFNCYPDKIYVEVKCENGKLFFNENEINPKANCVCPYDLSWQTGPLEYKEYNLIFMRDQMIFAEFEIKFTATLDSLIYLEL